MLCVASSRGDRTCDLRQRTGLRVVMPTLVWVIRPKSGTSGAAAVGGSAREAAATVPDPVVSATCTYLPRDPVQVALPRVSSKRCADADGGTKKKRKIKPRAAAATSATKTVRDLPRGVQKKPSGKFESSIMKCYIGTFDTAEQASAAYLYVRKDLDDATVSSCGAHEVDAVFDKAKQKAIDSFGAFDPEKRDLPTGVYKLRSGKYQSRIKWGRKPRRIGMFDTPEQASAAYMSVRKDLDDAEACGAHEVEVVFDEAKKNSLAAFGGFVPEERDLPQGVRKTQNGKYDSRMHWRGKQRTIGTFATPEQASAAFMFVRRDLDDAKLRPCGSDNAKSAIFDAAKNKALEAVIATR